MAVAALKQKFEPQLRTFHATMLVTRAEEWCVEAESAEEARELLAAGQGHRCHLGERLLRWRALRIEGPMHQSGRPFDLFLLLNNSSVRPAIARQSRLSLDVTSADRVGRRWTPA